MRKYVVLLAFAASCGGSESDPEPSNPDASNLVDALVNAHCERVFACCTQDDLSAVFVAQQVTTEAECQVALKNRLSAFYQQSVEAAIAAESVELVANESDCESKLKAQACGEFVPGEPTEISTVCDETLVPLLENSGFCRSDFECKSGFCSFNIDQDTGSCTVIPSDGEPCANLRCGDASFCDPVSEVCVSKIEDDLPCAQNEQCRSGLCEIENAQGTCRAVPQICQG